MFWFYPHMFWFGSGFFPTLINIFFIILFISFVFSLFRSKNGQGEQEKEERPLEILKKRYANGDITKKEFEQIKKDIAN